LTKYPVTRIDVADCVSDTFANDGPSRVELIERAGHDCGKRMQIGDVAKRTALSLRSIRYYEEAGLVTPSTRTVGGFRLYTESDCERLQLIKQMKPLGFSLEEMRNLLYVLDRLADGAEEAAKGAFIERLHDFTHNAEERCERLREQLAVAVGFADMLRQRLMHESSRGGS